MRDCVQKETFCKGLVTPNIEDNNMQQTGNKVIAFLHNEAFNGLLLIFATIAAMICANTGLRGWYEDFFATELSLRFGAYALNKPVLLWVNDGLMAIFFFLIGLELKREMREGVLSNREQVVLPSAAALGGMAVPALIYLLITFNYENLHHGWAIPAATDIAFALGVAAMLGKSVPPQLRAFLLTLAVLDDMGAIIIIALFYTSQLSVVTLLGAGFCALLLLALNRSNVIRIAPYVLVSLIMWFFVLKSGVHATLAGVAAAFAIPLRNSKDNGHSPLRNLENGLHPYVVYLVVPLFAFANAGVSFQNMSLSIAFEPLVLAIALGLLLGKPIGICLASYIIKRMKLADLPAGVNWQQMWGVGLLAGIGFTMSLFIGTLSFSDMILAAEVRLGVLGGSTIAAIAGYLVLRSARKSAERHS